MKTSRLISLLSGNAALLWDDVGPNFAISTSGIRMKKENKQMDNYNDYPYQEQIPENKQLAKILQVEQKGNERFLEKIQKAASKGWYRPEQLPAVKQLWSGSPKDSGLPPYMMEGVDNYFKQSFTTDVTKPTWFWHQNKCETKEKQTIGQHTIFFKGGGISGMSSPRLRLGAGLLALQSMCAAGEGKDAKGKPFQLKNCKGFSLHYGMQKRQENYINKEYIPVEALNEETGEMEIAFYDEQQKLVKTTLHDVELTATFYADGTIQDPEDKKEKQQKQNPKGFPILSCWKLGDWQWRKAARDSGPRIAIVDPADGPGGVKVTGRFIFLKNAFKDYTKKSPATATDITAELNSCTQRVQELLVKDDKGSPIENFQGWYNTSVTTKLGSSYIAGLTSFALDPHGYYVDIDGQPTRGGGQNSKFDYGSGPCAPSGEGFGLWSDVEASAKRNAPDDFLAFQERIRFGDDVYDFQNFLWIPDVNIEKDPLTKLAFPEGKKFDELVTNGKDLWTASIGDSEYLSYPDVFKYLYELGLQDDEIKRAWKVDLRGDIQKHLSRTWYSHWSEWYAPQDRVPVKNPVFEAGVAHAVVPWSLSLGESDDVLVHTGSCYNVEGNDGLEVLHALPTGREKHYDSGVYAGFSEEAANMSKKSWVMPPIALLDSMPVPPLVLALFDKSDVVQKQLRTPAYPNHPGVVVKTEWKGDKFKVMKEYYIAYAVIGEKKANNPEKFKTFLEKAKFQGKEGSSVYDNARDSGAFCFVDYNTLSQLKA